jgi:signal peptide peptidase SppA
MTQRANLMTEVSGLMSVEEVGFAIEQAVADPAFEAIVLDVDSPGGSVYGVQELADKVYAARRSKPVVAVANAVAASAAYYVAAQASELIVTPSGAVGSVGVYLMHVDRSGEMDKQGVRVTFVSAGERKTAGNEFAPLDDAGREEMDRAVQGYYRQFLAAVARGRNTSTERVRSDFGKGGMLLAAEAVRAGMADRVGTLDAVLGRYGHSLSGAPTLAPKAAATGSAPVAARSKGRDWELEKRRRLLQLD